MFQHILVPLDGSTLAEQALPVAARLAQATDGTVGLVRVVSPSNEYEAYVTLQPITTHHTLKTEFGKARGYLDNLTHLDSLAGVHTETAVITSEAATGILSVADTRPIDLIVMSSHGCTGMAHWIMGSVAEKVARYAPVPVLILRVLREDKPLLANMHPDDGVSLRALVPLDGSARAEAAIPPAAHLVAALSAPGRGVLHLTRVVIPGIDAISHHRREALLQEAKEDLNATVDEIREGLMADYGPDLHLSITCSATIDDDIAAGIVRIAKNGAGAVGADVFDGSDLIAMATHGYSGLQRWALGSITERVLHASRLPLMIVRSPGVPASERHGADQPAAVPLDR